MKAAYIERYGKAAPVIVGERPEPELRERDVLVRVHAAGVNVIDNKIKAGEFRQLLPYDLPLTLGCDVAGVVTRVGPAVTRFRPGDEVYACSGQDRIGTFAEAVAMDEAVVARKPATLSMEEAAGVPLVALTAWQALVERAGLRAGQKVFIQAGSGGVGSVAIQLAKHLGAHVATSCSTRNVELVRSLEADVVVDYTRERSGDALEGYDLVLHSLGPDELRQSLRILKPGGQVISISGPPDAGFAESQGAGWVLKQVFRLLSLRVKRAARRKGVRYSFLFLRADGDQLSRITGLIEAGVLRSVLDRTFPLERTAEALAYVETGRARGKVVVKVA